jgi:DNA polymerase III sliding clamp (beta) subunit (PCNA family)
VLHSEDIDVTVPDKTVKDRVYRLPSTDELKIFKKNYLVKMSEISLSVRVIEKKRADNSQLAAVIYTVLKTIVLGL